MKASELRIGNYLYDNQERVCIVNAIGYDFCEHEISAPAIIGAITSYPNKPILLTEEWLLKFGFEHNIGDEKNTWYIPGFGYDISNGYFWKYEDLYNADCEEYVQIKDVQIITVLSKNIKYVHQLQNLYFVLTGEEIELTQ